MNTTNKSKKTNNETTQSFAKILKPSKQILMGNTK